MRLWSRYGTDFTDRLRAIADAVRALPVDNALIDGEAVVFQPGRPFRLRRAAHEGRRRASLIGRVRPSRPRWRISTKPATHSNRKPATEFRFEAGQAFRQEAGHRFRFEAGRDFDLMSATWRLLPRIHAMMFCPEPLVKRAWFGCPQELEWRWVTADGARFPLRRSAARRYPRPCRAESRAQPAFERPSISWRGSPLAEAVAGEFDAVGVVNEAVENGIGDGWIADDLVPAVDGDLAGQDDGSDVVADPRRFRGGRDVARPRVSRVPNHRG